MEDVSVLIAKAQAGDKVARKVLIEENLGLVHATVRRFLGRGVEAEDLFQIGTIGLMKAVDRFDLSYDVKFSTYAVPLITGEIKRFLRDDGPVKVSRTLKENALKVKMARQKLQNSLKREPTLQEIGREAGLSSEELVMAMEADVQVESFDAPVYQSGDSEVYLVDTLSAGTEEKEGVLNHMLVEQLLSGLGEEERYLIRMRFYQRKSQTEVAKSLGISQVQVSRMEKRILLQMRERCC